MNILEHYEEYKMPYFRPRKRRSINGMPVRERETCPDCGKKLVNLYFKGGEWKCKKCWEENDHA